MRRGLFAVDRGEFRVHVAHAEHRRDGLHRRALREHGAPAVGLHRRVDRGLSIARRRVEVRAPRERERRPDPDARVGRIDAVEAREHARRRVVRREVDPARNRRLRRQESEHVVDDAHEHRAVLDAEVVRDVEHGRVHERESARREVAVAECVRVDEDDARYVAEHAAELIDRAVDDHRACAGRLHEFRVAARGEVPHLDG